MSLPTGLVRFDGLVEVLTLCADRELRERILLEMALASGCCQAAAIWRREAASSGPCSSGRFHVATRRGRVETLPPPELTLAALEGRIPAPLPGRHVVLCSGTGPGSVALALADAESDAASMDLLEALFQVWAAVERASPAVPDRLSLLELPAAALPGSRMTVLPALPWKARDGLMHDLRNLLTSLGLSRQLELAEASGWPCEERAELTRSIDRGCHRAGQLLLEALGAQPGHERESCCPALVLADVVRSERAAYLRREMELRVSLAPAAQSLCAAIDETGLARCLSNLLVNAREALGLRLPLREASIRGAWARAECLAGQGPARGVILLVEDNGLGFPLAGKQEWNAGNTAFPASSKGHGRGQGLPTVRAIVERAHGQLRLRNVPTGGARVEIWLPSKPA